MYYQIQKKILLCESIQRVELYSYNYKTKQPKLLASYAIDSPGECHCIDQVIQDYNIETIRVCCKGVRRKGCFRIFDQSKQSTVYYENTVNKFYHTTVTGFSDGKGAWYLYFAQPGYFTDYSERNIRGSAILRIDKKTKKVTKL